MSSNYQLIRIILPKGKATKVLKFAKKHGVTGGTIELARGTESNKLLKFLSIYDDSRELLMMATDKETFDKVVPLIVEKFELEKPNKGILFSTIINTLYSTDGIYKTEEQLGVSMYKLLTIIVEKGKAEDIVETANQAGARGGTILHGRGAGTTETRMVFNIEIEPEKDILLIVAKNDNYKAIVDAINDEHHIQNPGKGILFVQDITEAHGLYE